MDVLIKIFLMFAKLSIFAFGGGYVMFPMLLNEVEQNGIIDIGVLSDIITIAGMSPGAVSVNAAVGTGYESSGFAGAAAAFLGIAIPCTVIVILVATLFFKIYDKPLVKSALYGLRPVIAGIILYAAVKLAQINGIAAAKPDNMIDKGYNVLIAGTQLFEVKSIIIFAVTFLLLLKTKIHPFFIIIGAAAAGILIF